MCEKESFEKESVCVCVKRRVFEKESVCERECSKRRECVCVKGRVCARQRERKGMREGESG